MKKVAIPVKESPFNFLRCRIRKKLLFLGNQLILNVLY